MNEAKPSPTLGRPFFQFFSQHLAAISAIAIVMAYLSSTIFLYAYLSVFDWRLIWIVEPADVVKVGLVATGVISGFAVWIYLVVDDVYHWVFGTVNLWWIKFSGVILLAISLAVNLYAQYESTEPHYGLVIYFHLSLIFLMLFTLQFMTAIKSTSVTAKSIISMTFIAVVTIVVFGRTYGYYVRDTDGFRHNVRVKGRDYVDAGVVMFTSHHAVFYFNGESVVVPAAAVEAIESRKKQK